MTHIHIHTYTHTHTHAHTKTLDNDQLEISCIHVDYCVFQIFVLPFYFITVYLRL